MHGSNVSRLGDIHDDVAELQQGLAAAGYYQGGITREFDVLTEDAVKEFQRANGLLDHGLADELLWTHLQPGNHTAHSPGAGNLW